MLCSAQELQLQLGKTAQEGIVELPGDAPVGADFYAYFCANDHILDIEITPNRGDCLSLLGIARDLSAVNKIPITPVDIELVPSASKDTLPIVVSAEASCPRYMGRVIQHINNMAETPSWIQHCLQRANIRLVNPVVDVCNYVMIELGQPMHGFDLATLKKEIHVRHAHKDEKIILLDDSEITLTQEDLVVADHKNAHALAGIMGGKASGVSTETTAIFLEAAFFSPKTICLSARRHGITSDAAHRF